MYLRLWHYDIDIATAPVVRLGPVASATVALWYSIATAPVVRLGPVASATVALWYSSFATAPVLR